MLKEEDLKKENIWYPKMMEKLLPYLLPFKIIKSLVFLNPSLLLLLKKVSDTLEKQKDMLENLFTTTVIEESD